MPKKNLVRTKEGSWHTTTDLLPSEITQKNTAQKKKVVKSKNVTTLQRSQIRNELNQHVNKEQP
jgi:hypothetical protein